MDEKAVLDALKKAVEKELSCSAHDIDHVMRVHALCITLAENEAIDMEVLESAAILHDIARAKEDNDSSGKTDHALLGAKMAVPILEDAGFCEEKIRQIQHCIETHRYRGENKPQTMEAKILFDADKLDSLGAIGIARSFVWIGRNNAKIYTDTNLKEYARENLGGKTNGRIKDKTKHSPQIEFEAKAKHIVDKLHTKKAKEIGKERLKFYEEFLKRLEMEIKGKL
ncbi:MAG: phosphohydrolase [Candidatus Nanohalarchaeota archaeon]|nr:MAG: phosphohydrolase [Candidatus Nanohaloarchaeota archaeon]